MATNYQQQLKTLKILCQENFSQKQIDEYKSSLLRKGFTKRQIRRACRKSK